MAAAAMSGRRLHPYSAELAKLIKLLGMLGSAHEGERAVAGLKATELLRSLNMTWPDVINPIPHQLALPDTHKTPPSGIRPELALLRNNLDLLTPWERRFVFDLGRFRRLSPKQRTVVDKLVRKVQKRAA
jgi:hypothetical protein